MSANHACAITSHIGEGPLCAICLHSRIAGHIKTDFSHPRVRSDMRTTYLPRVTAADHEALRRLVDNYPADSYEKWLYLQAKEIANWQKSRWRVILIDVSADDFVRYCRDTGASRNYHTFRGIASAKAIGKFN